MGVFMKLKIIHLISKKIMVFCLAKHASCLCVNRPVIALFQAEFCFVVCEVDWVETSIEVSLGLTTKGEMSWWDTAYTNWHFWHKMYACEYLCALGCTIKRWSCILYISTVKNFWKPLTYREWIGSYKAKNVLRKPVLELESRWTAGDSYTKPEVYLTL